MGHFSMEKPPNPGSVLGENQQSRQAASAEEEAEAITDVETRIAEPDNQEQQDGEIVIENPEIDEDEEILNWTENRLQQADSDEADVVQEAEAPAEETQSRMMDRLRGRIEQAQQDEEFEAGWQEFMSGDGGPPTTEADDAEARADAILRAMDEGRDPYVDGYDDFEAREAAAEADLERQAYGDSEYESDPDGEAQMAEDRHFAEMPTEVDIPEEHDRQFEMAPVHRYEDDDHKTSQNSATVSRSSITQAFSDADRERVDNLETRVDDALKDLAAAKQSGDANSIADARHALADANRDYKDYLLKRVASDVIQDSHFGFVMIHCGSKENRDGQAATDGVA